MSMPHPADHGDYVPGKGFYDRTMRAWRADPAKLTPIDEGTPLTTSHVASFKAWGKHNEFKANPNLEKLRRLRDSERPEERETAEKLLAGGMRMQVANYEKRIQEHIHSGHELPDGVVAPKGDG